MQFNFPETIFVEKNNLRQQLDHVLEEVTEICEAGPEFDLHMMMEIADLTHSLETFWRKAQQVVGHDAVTFVFDSVIEKNERRGYYLSDPLAERVKP